jgi:hypothetical protein
MLVKLLKDKREGGQVKVTVKNRTKKAYGWFEGTEHEVSDATGRKLIEAKEAVEVKTAAVGG